jgi:hypothetical protein
MLVTGCRRLPTARSELCLLAVRGGGGEFYMSERWRRWWWRRDRSILYRDCHASAINNTHRSGTAAASGYSLPEEGSQWRRRGERS